MLLELGGIVKKYLELEAQAALVHVFAVVGPLSVLWTKTGKELGDAACVSK